jgi:hypothetical protein
MYQRSPKRLEADLVKALPRLLPSLHVRRASLEQRVGSTAVDAVVEVTTPRGGKRRLLVDVTAVGVPSRVRETLRHLKASLSKQITGYPMLASTFFSPRVREICREEGVGYLDLAGNCFLQFDDFYLEKIVDRNPFPSRGRPPSLFSPVSSRILRALLEEPQRMWKVSELAHVTHTSLGQASNVTRRLLGEEYLARVERRLRFTRPANLLEAWREQYSWAKETQRAYYSFERAPEQLMARVAEIAQTRQWRYAVTSFAGASLVAPFVHGVGTLQFYVDHELAVDPWVQALDLRPVEEGPNVVLCIPFDEGVFYRTHTVNDVVLVGNIQLYLDLYSDPGRGREQAEFLRKERLGF